MPGAATAREAALATGTAAACVAARGGAGGWAASPSTLRLTRAVPQEGAIMQWTQRHPGRWLAPCRDLDGRRCQLIVTPIGTGRIALIVPPGAVAILEVLAAG